MFIPFLADKYKLLCAASQLLAYLDRVKQLDVAPINVPDLNDKPLLAKPLFICKKNQNSKYTPLKEDTLRNYFKIVFLDNVQDTMFPDCKLSGQYKPHSCRNAVASDSMLDLAVWST